jgi:hypothetical protein
VDTAIDQVAQNATNVASDAITSGIQGLSDLATPPPNSAAAFVDQNQYMFPSDLVNGTVGRNYFINFTFVKYERRSIFDNPTFNRQLGIQLPIPVNLMDATNVSWGEGDSIGLAAGAALEAAIKGRDNGINKKNVSSAIKNAFIGGLTGAATTVGRNLTAGIAGYIPGTNGQAVVSQVEQLYGLAENPFMTMLFKSPVFKTHSFSWRFAPRNASESNELMMIINAFKANMLPALQPGTGGVFLSYPNMAYITLFPSDVYLYQFKPCVVTSLSVDYAAAGVPSFFKGTSAPTLVDMTVNLAEIEYWLREDIIGGNRGDGVFGTGNASPASRNGA